MADIYIDSEHKDTMDQFAYTRARMPRYDQSSVPFRWSIDGLSMGEHTVRIVAKGQKGDRATGSIIRLSGAKVYRLRKY